MHITDLKLRQFRNYDDVSLDGFGMLNIFCGPNAVGKTNLLEAIALLTTTSSFRHSQIDQLVKHGSESARIQLDMTDGNRALEVALFLEPGKKSFTVNGKAKASQDVRGSLPAVTFVPDDLELAKKASSVKRAALDRVGIQLSKSYGIVHRDYEKALRYKNRLLKEDASQALVDSINETLLVPAAQLYCFRRALYERMLPLVKENYQGLSQSKESFEASYIPSWLRMQNRYPELSSFAGQTAFETDRARVKELLYEAMAAYGEEEMRARRACIGPHNDQISFFIEGRDAAAYASQGQQRSAVLAWKLAEVQVVRQMLACDPVLLLDDVMSELDEARRDLFIGMVGDGAQTFITATDLSPFNAALLEKAHIMSLPFEQGNLEDTCFGDGERGA